MVVEVSRGDSVGVRPKLRRLPGAVVSGCVAVVVVGLAVLACSRESELEVRDTEQREFQAHCGRQGCTLEQVRGPGLHDGSAPIMKQLGRLLAVCDAGADDEPAAPRCRAVACNETDDCPSVPALGTLTCERGLCADVARPVSVDDRVVLCLAGTGLGLEKPEQMERYGLALNCTGACAVPAPCRQP